MTVSLRPATVQDRDLLFQIYAGTRRDEFAALDWPPEQLAGFLQMQWRAQQRHYQSAYPNAEDSIVVVNDAGVGRMLVDCSPTDIVLVDLALLPEYRNRGIGTSLLNKVLAKGDSEKKPVRLSVIKSNPAVHWYQCFGFSQVADDGVYLGLERLPAEAASVVSPK